MRLLVPDTPRPDYVSDVTTLICDLSIITHTFLEYKKTTIVLYVTQGRLKNSTANGPTLEEKIEGFLNSMSLSRDYT